MYLCKYIVGDTKKDKPFCKITQEICPLIRYCRKDSCYYNTDIAKQCKYIGGDYMKKDGNVLFVKCGRMFVKYKNDIISVPFNGGKVPKDVKIVVYKNKYYIKGTEPKNDE